MKANDLAARLRTAFLGELEEQVRMMNADLLALEREPGDAGHLKSLFRVAHTVKGAARAAAVPLIEQACHELESLLAKARDRKLQLGPDQFALLYAAADALADAGHRLRAGESLADSPLAALHATVATSASAPAPASARRAVRTGASPAAPTAAPTSARSSESQVRVKAERLDELLTSAGQLLVARRQAAVWTAEFEELHQLASRAAAEWRREGRAVRLALERSGAAARTVQAVSGVEESFRRLVRESERLATVGIGQARALNAVTNDVLTRVRQLRIRPFADACEALPRAVRDLAAASGKDVQLTVRGGEVEADRAVLDGLREALLHIVRNAVDHGIEPPDARLRAGKPRQGTVTVAAALREDRIVVTVSDDGAGLNVGAIRSRIERMGMPVPGDDRDVARALLQGGLSTRTEATPVSGRGVGLDLVRAALEQVRGSVDLRWEEGRGTTLILQCPPTLASIRALLAIVASQTIAIPTTHLERLLRVTPASIKRVEGRDVLAGEGTPVPLVSLARILSPLVEKPVAGPLLVVLLRAGEQRLAVVVDELVAEEEIVLQPLSGTRGNGGNGRLPLLSGAALLGTGSVALVLDVAAVVAAGLGLDAGGLTFEEARPAGRAKSRILVVDDSITTRTLEQSILEAAGYDVLTAVDGADGWRQLQERGADLVVADIEMPRMDGFALCEAMRSSTRFKALPVVLVTALETPEHRARGLEVGADAYIGKSSFDQQGLLDTIHQLLGQD